MTERQMILPPKPERTETDPKKADYTRITYRLTRDFIYEDVSISEIEKRIAEIRKDANVEAFEQQYHELESLLDLMKGIEAHEQANSLHSEAWQAEIIRTKPDAPETLSREEIANAFESFPLRDKLIESETQAIKRYQAFLALNEDPEIYVSQNVKLQRKDIEMLINDLQARVFERIPDQKERKTKLAKLDRELNEIIENLSDDDWGQRLELEEIYLIRRLIHSSDTGHLVSVSHGTPREDFRPDRESIDIIVSAAGDTLAFQLKTFKRGVSRIARERQSDVYEIAKEHAEHSTTNLVVLEAESVNQAYESAVRRSSTATVKRAEAYETLQPLIDSLEDSSQETSGESVRHRLITLLGLSEHDLEQERLDFQNKHVNLLKHQESYRAEEQRKAERAAEIEKQRHEAELAEEEAERQRLRANIQLQEASATQSEEERKRTAIEKEMRIKEKQAEREIERIEAQKIAEERERQRVEQEEERKKKNRANYLRSTLPQRKIEARGNWPPPELDGLINAQILQQTGFLDQNWSGQADALLAAKNQFMEVFALPKPKKLINSKRKPNASFKKVFDTRESLASPTDEDRKKIQAFLQKLKAA